LLSAHQAFAGPLRLGATADCPGLLFHKLRLVTVLFCSTVALKHLREEAKHQVFVLVDAVQVQVLVDAVQVQIPFESMPWLV
jgi:hypothetical protein